MQQSASSLSYRLSWVPPSLLLRRTRSGGGSFATNECPLWESPSGWASCFPPAYLTFVPHAGATTILLDLLAGNCSSEPPTVLTRFPGRSGDVPPLAMSDHSIFHCLTRRCHRNPATTGYAHCSSPLPWVGDYAHSGTIRFSLVHVCCWARPTRSRVRHVITTDDLVGTSLYPVFLINVTNEL